MKSKLFFAAALFCCAAGLFAGTLKFEHSINRKNGIYKIGEKIEFTVKLFEDGKFPADKFIQYRIYHDHKIAKRGRVTAAKELKLSTSLNKPGWVFIDLWAKDAKNKFIKVEKKIRGKVTLQTLHSGVGAMVEPEKILPFLPEPKDFDAFWNKVKAEIAAVPMKVLEKKQVGSGKINCYDIKISCAGDKPVSGYLCMPANAKAKSCPAIVTFHGAGVRSSVRNYGMANRGLIALDINAHGIENGKPAKFYADLRKNYYYTTHDKYRQKRYALWNRHDRDLYYFKGMYMRLIRALEYVKSLPEWDGKHLIVSGGSQGGAQVIAACGLDKDITFAYAGVPAQCDHSGCLGDRRSGWPFLYTAKEHKANPAYAKCASYYDGAYFARRIKCRIYFSTGFMDSVCPPSSVYAAYNSIPAGVEKHIQTTPHTGHSSPRDQSQKALNEYIMAITKKK